MSYYDLFNFPFDTCINRIFFAKIQKGGGLIAKSNQCNKQESHFLF